MNGLPENVTILDAHRPPRPVSELPHETIIRALPAALAGAHHQASSWSNELPGLPSLEELSKFSANLRELERWVARLEVIRAQLDCGPEGAA